MPKGKNVINPFLMFKYKHLFGYKHYTKSKLVEQSYKIEGEWNSLWCICAPPKTKHLLWRICHGYLPTRIQLKERYVSGLGECPLCLNNEEGDWHILFGCSEGRQVWNEVGMREVVELRLHGFSNVKTVLFDICRNESIAVVKTVAMIAWCTWHNKKSKTTVFGRGLKTRRRMLRCELFL
jgi:hypothetical protein